MQRSRIPDWLAAVLPALAWVLFRYAGKSLPPAAEGILAWIVPATAVLWYCLRKNVSAFRLSFREFLLWTGAGIAFGILDRLCLGKPAGQNSSVSAFLLLCILSPAAEEVVYRGFVYERGLRFLPAAGALACTQPTRRYQIPPIQNTWQSHPKTCHSYKQHKPH